MSGNHIKSASEVKEEFKRNGICISEWARNNGFSKEYVHSILNGNSKCNFGIGHKIAVKLGIKDGEIQE